jgi:ABC-type lipoprotein export system ATPase subunit
MYTPSTLSLTPRLKLSGRRYRNCIITTCNQYAECDSASIQCAAIARALVTNLVCVLADELTGNLDKVTAHNIVTMMKTLAHETQFAMVLVTHDLSVADICDMRYTLSQGSLV